MRPGGELRVGDLHVFNALDENGLSDVLPESARSNRMITI
jgi:hypothetical protein